MSRKISFLIGLVLVLLLSGTVYAQGPEVQHSDPNWQVSYWNNMTLHGPSVQQVVKAAHVCLTDPNLRNGGAPAGQFDHFRPCARVERDIDFFELRALVAEKTLGGCAIGAEFRGIYLHGGHFSPIRNCCTSVIYAGLRDREQGQRLAHPRARHPLSGGPDCTLQRWRR